MMRRLLALAALTALGTVVFAWRLDISASSARRSAAGGVIRRATARYAAAHDRSAPLTELFALAVAYEGQRGRMPPDVDRQAATLSPPPQNRPSPPPPPPTMATPAGSGT